MVQYIDNGVLIGWFYTTEGCYYGDGTYEEAERIEEERRKL